MKVGIMMALFGRQTLDQALEIVAKAGVEAVEIGTGNYPGSPHCPVDDLLQSQVALNNWKARIRDKGLEISALSCHGNPLHPDRKFAEANHEVHRKTVKLARKLGVEVVINFSGCPGDSDKAVAPNWVTCPWPPDFANVVKWQWEKKVIPYWRREAKFAKENNVKLAFEMHPGFVVYNTETLLRLREACGDNIGANFDPSHLWWQGMDPVASLRKLGPAVFHFHAKDCKVDRFNTCVNGVLDTKHYGDELHRSWIFRTVGYGHGEEVWRDIISTLRLIGYDGALSIEHEDSLMSTGEGFTKGVEFLKRLVIKEKTGAMWWA